MAPVTVDIRPLAHHSGSGDIFEVADVIAIEPGIGCPAIQRGIRMYDNYVVRESGLENLLDFPMELHPT